MRIPNRLQELLGQDDTLHGGILSTISTFEPIIKDNKMPFFPEYTDHGIDHIESVMATASSLISDDAWKCISSSDTAVLILSCLLHDMAMHITEDGFISLVSISGNPLAPIWSEDRPWSDLWLDFLSEASRFDGRKLISLFGNSDPIERPTLQPDKMTKRDKLLIGEFLRRHHHRLAHEISIYGFPGVDGGNMRMVEISNRIAGLAGIIARSHGMPMRSCIAHLVSPYDKRECFEVHPPFLMAILRISDYLQIQQERAPGGLLKIKRLLSPISSREWTAHEAIEDIRNNNDDPELVFVEAHPKNVKSFLRVKEWVSGIQQELDTSWAAIGEIYGRIPGLKNLGLVTRRIRSNIDDVDSFAKEVDYIPTKASFQASNPDLLKLLIGPLYGDSPEIGLRELVQNSVDAVRELREYVKQRPDLKPDVIDQEADVQILIEKLDNGSWYITVSDRGIGMSAEIIQDYFLKVGATYRKSDDWRSRFEGTDGKSCVLRAGRFGIGALAAFLLGHEIEVTTRHIDSPIDEGIRFRTTLEEENIELQKAKCPVGTAICIPIAPNIVEYMMEWINAHTCNHIGYELPDMDMYCLEYPSVIRKIRSAGNRDEIITQQYTLPLPKSELSPEWHRIIHQDYLDIQWTYSSSPYFVCNGIVVSMYYTPNINNQTNWETWWSMWDDETMDPPNISVFDSQVKLPLTLQRTGVSNCRCPFGDILLEDVAKDLIAYFMVMGPDTYPISRHDRMAVKAIHYQGTRVASETGDMFFTSKGYSIPLYWHLHNAKLDRAIVIAYRADSSSDQRLPVFPSTLGVFYISYQDSIYESQEDIKRKRLKQLISLLGLGAQIDNASYITYLNNILAMPVTGRGILLNEQYIDIEDLKLERPYEHHLAVNQLSPGWIILNQGEYQDNTQYLEQFQGLLIDSKNEKLCNMVAQWSLAKYDDWPVSEKETVIERMWREIVGQAIIPYSLEERREQLAHVYKELGPYIEKHEMLRNQKK